MYADTSTNKVSLTLRNVEVRNMKYYETLINIERENIDTQGVHYGNYNASVALTIEKTKVADN